MVRDDEHFVGNAKKWLVRGIIAFVLSTSVCLAASNRTDLSFLTQEERTWLKSHQVIRIGYDAVYPPIEFEDSFGRYYGVVADYLSVIERKLGIQFKRVHYPNRKAILEALRSHQIDAVAALAMSHKHERHILFTEPYISLTMVIVARQSVTKDLTLDQLKGMRVSLIESSSIHEYLHNNYPQIQLDPVDSFETGLKKVSFGVTDAFIGNIATATYYIAKTKITNLHIVGETEISFDLGFASRADWPMLNSIVNKTLKQISKQERKSIFKRWIYLAHRPIISNRQLLIGISVSLVIIGLVLGGFFVWTMSLRRMVHLRTVELDHELTERRRAEAEVRKLNDELESRVIIRTAELAVANKELESFSYSVSHDLRTPLRSLDGFSQLLLETYGPRFDEEGQNYLKRIRAASQRMAQLIDDLLKLARVTRDQMHMETVDLSRLAMSIIYEMKKNYPDRKIEFVIEPGLDVQADETLIEVVLRNLLENAWKFTQKASNPRIEFGSETVDGRRAFFVRDNGVGFDMAYVAKLFKPFQRLHSDTEFEGTGIGLATVQRIVNRHGGRVWAQGAVNKGATFYFTLGSFP